MSISRRFFLIGSGAVVTAAFVKDAVRFVERRSRPLLIKPDRIETELFYYEGFGDGDASLITLGQWVDIEDVVAPTTWREYYRRYEGRALDGQADINRLCREGGITEQRLDQPMLDRSWQDAWDYWWSPHARAYQLLQSLDLGPLRKRAGLRVWGGQLIFDEFLRPGDNSRVVNAEDAVTLSLLQARLIELGLPYRLREGE
jgi:hypothetical protein